MFVHARSESDAHGPAYRAFAAPAAGVFAGIARYYAREFDAAERELRSVLVLQGVAENVKARAANGIGYISFLKGNVVEANRILASAISLHPAMSIPRINQGYVLFSVGDWDRARHHYENLLQRPVGGELSPRDTVLAQLGLAHALSQSSNSEDTAKATRVLAEVLRKLRVNDYEYLNDEPLRRAFQLTSIARNVYLFNRDYYALEPVAVMCLAQACEHWCRIASDDAIEAKSSDYLQLQSDLEWPIRTAVEATKQIPIVNREQPGFLASRRMLSENGCLCRSGAESAKQSPSTFNSREFVIVPAL